MATQQVLGILRRCERDLKKILQQAAESGEYDKLFEVGRWARNVAGIALEAEEALSIGTTSPVKVSNASAAQAPVEARPTPTSQQSGAEHGVKKNSKQRKATAYPRFVRRDDELIKIGWSKKQKKQYQHKSPKYVLELLRNALLNSKADTQTISTDEFFPLRDKDGGEVPGYQAYVCLAWFKAEELVVQEGRQGYRVLARNKLAEALSARWEALSQV